MAPEQAVGNNAAVSSVTDVYGLGAVLYQLLTGQPPFAGGATYETIKLLLDTEPRQPRLLNPKIDRDLSTICLKCLEKDPKRRYSSALALAEDLERWLKHEPIRPGTLEFSPAEENGSTQSNQRAPGSLSGCFSSGRWMEYLEKRINPSSDNNRNRGSAV